MKKIIAAIAIVIGSIGLTTADTGANVRSVPLCRAVLRNGVIPPIERMRTADGFNTGCRGAKGNLILGVRFCVDGRRLLVSSEPVGWFVEGERFNTGAPYASYAYVWAFLNCVG